MTLAVLNKASCVQKVVSLSHFHMHTTQVTCSLWHAYRMNIAKVRPLDDFHHTSIILHSVLTTGAGNQRKVRKEEHERPRMFSPTLVMLLNLVCIVQNDDRETQISPLFFSLYVLC